jgi:hypothetical protein
MSCGHTNRPQSGQLAVAGRPQMLHIPIIVIAAEN